MTPWEILSLVASLLALAGMAATWGEIRSKVKDLWDIHDQVVISIEHSQVMWDLIMEKAVVKGLVERQSPPIITEKGLAALPQTLKGLVDDLVAARPGLAPVRYIAIVFHEISKASQETQEDPELLAGLVEAYIRKIAQPSMNNNTPHHPIEKYLTWRVGSR